MDLTSYENMKWIRVAMAAVYMCANFPWKQDTSTDFQLLKEDASPQTQLFALEN